MGSDVKKRLLYILGCAVSLAFAASLALAQQGGQGIAVTSPTGKEQITVTGVGPQYEWIAVSQARDATGYSKQVPTAGASITIPNNVSHLVLSPGATLATLTIITPATVYDGSLFCVFTTQAITALTMTANTGQTLNGALTAMTANQSAPCWVYSASNATWDRAE